MARTLSERLAAATGAELRAISFRLGSAVRIPRTAGERRDLIAAILDKSPGATTRCADCGELGERTGHMGCQYPRDRE